MAKPSRTTLRSLTPDPRNANKGSERGTGMLEHSLRQYGAGRSLLVDKHGVVIAGNKTLEAAASLGMDEIQIVQSDGTKLVVVQRTDLDLAKDAKAKELAVADNRVAQVSLDWDADVLRQLADEGADLSALFTKDELADLVDVEPVAGRTDPDDVPEPRATDIKLGDMFQLGRHRLLCGDSTKAEDVARVMDGQRADATITDPPYAVNYERSQKARGGNAAVHSPYKEGDTAESVLVFMRHLPSDVLVMTFPVDRHFTALATEFISSGLEVRKECVWVKDSFSFWPGAQYQQQHEPILICAKRGRPVNSDVPANQSTVFELPRPKAHDMHPTSKPVELFVKLVSFHAPDRVYEPFSGSGTTMMACEQTGRACYAIEMAPQYCQVAIDRWEAFTGQKAEKVGEVALAS